VRDWKSWRCAVRSADPPFRDEFLSCLAGRQSPHASDRRSRLCLNSAYHYEWKLFCLCQNPDCWRRAWVDGLRGGVDTASYSFSLKYDGKKYNRLMSQGLPEMYPAGCCAWCIIWGLSSSV
jgi:hypothetical protein